MVKWLKRLFCKHIYDLAERRELYEAQTMMGIFIIATHQVYADRMRCIKCGREEWQERRISKKTI